MPDRVTRSEVTVTGVVPAVRVTVPILVFWEFLDTYRAFIFHIFTDKLPHNDGEVGEEVIEVDIFAATVCDIGGGVIYSFNGLFLLIILFLLGGILSHTVLSFVH
jgi:hypothetical protein